MRFTLLAVFTAVSLSSAEYHHPSGFKVNLPQGWRAESGKGGLVMLSSQDMREVAVVQPIFDRRESCTGILRKYLASGTAQVEISAAGPRLARATYAWHNGADKGSMLCAEIGPRTGMLYGISAPAGSFGEKAGMLTAILQSFSFEARRTNQSGGGGAPAMPQLRAWREPNEGAYTMGVPVGWSVSGGINRQGLATGYRVQTIMSSPNGSFIRGGDYRFESSCAILGSASYNLPGVAAWARQHPCPMENGTQFGQRYTQALAGELGLSNASIVSITPMRELERIAMEKTAALRQNVSIAEVRFQGSRGGVPFAGLVLATVKILPGSDPSLAPGQKSLDVTAFAGPASDFDMLARLTGEVMASGRVDLNWFMQEQRTTITAGRQIVESIHATAAKQQQAFWDRISTPKSGQGNGVHGTEGRSLAVGNLLAGQNTVSDGNGHELQAQAGSNFYFRDENLARTAGRPEDAIVGRDSWPSSMVDLTPLQVIR